MTNPYQDQLPRVCATYSLFAFFAANRLASLQSNVVGSFVDKMKRAEERNVFTRLVKDSLSRVGERTQLLLDIVYRLA